MSLDKEAQPMVGKKVIKEVEKEAQKPLKGEPVYKVTQGVFEHRIEAIQAAGEVRRKGFPVSLIIKNEMYKLLFFESTSKAKVAEVVRNLAAVGIKSEII